MSHKRNLEIQVESTKEKKGWRHLGRFYLTSLPFFFLLTGCSLQPDQNVKLTLIVNPPKDSRRPDQHFSLYAPGTMHSFFRQTPVSYATDGNSSGFPESVSDFSCLAVNISGPGIAPSLTANPSNPVLDFSTQLGCTYPGITSQLVSITGGAIELDVPAGVNRVIQMLGISNGEECPSLSFSNFVNQNTNTSAGTTVSTFSVAQVAKTTTDLFRSTQVTLENSYSPDAIIDPFYCSTTTTGDFTIPISTNGLILAMYAAKPRGNTAPQGECTPNVWENLTGQTERGVFSGFPNCALSSRGWTGSGGAADPYRLIFDGTQSYVRVKESSVMNSSNMTIEVYARSVNTTPVANRYIISRPFSLSLQSFALKTNGSGGIQFVTYTGTENFSPALASPGDFFDTQMHQIVGVFERDSAANTNSTRLFFDGAAVSAGTGGTSTLRYGSFPLVIGKKFAELLSTTGLPIEINTVTLYNRALTAAEISNNCQTMRQFNNVQCQ